MTKKIIASFLSLTMALIMVPGTAQGATAEELLASIQDLQNQLNVLMAQYQTLTGTPAAGIPTACVGITFTANLSQGSTGNDVKCLQAFLNTDSATQVATTGAGSPGNETSYFGPLTYAAAVRFQNKYAAEILTPLGLTAGTGFVGPSTRAKLDAMLTATPPPPPPPVACTVDADCLTGEVCQVGVCVTPIVEPTEGLLEAKWLATPTAVQPNWGVTDLAVGALELKAKQSSITVDRIDITLTTTANAPWRIIDYLSLWDGNSEVGGSAINSASLIEVTLGTVYTLRLTGLGIDVPLDGAENLTVKVNVPARPYTTGEAIALSVGASGIRGVDTAGITQYCAATQGPRSFTVLAAAETGGLAVSVAADTPAEGVSILDANSATTHEILRFNLKATKDNLQVRQIAVDIATTTIGLITAVELWDGTTVIGSASPITGTSTFADLRLDIPIDTTKTLTVKVIYPAATSTRTITASVANAAVTVLGASGETVAKSGSATGNTITLAAVMPEVKLVSQSISLVPETTDKANATLYFSVTARGGNVYVSTSTATVGIVASSTAASSSAFSLDTTGLTASATNTYRILENQTVTFPVTGYIDNNSGTAAFCRFYLVKLDWGDVAGATTTQWTSASNSMMESIRTDSLYLTI